MAVDLDRLPAEGLELVDRADRSEGWVSDVRPRLWKSLLSMKATMLVSSSEDAIIMASQVEPSWISPSLSTV